MGELGNSGNTDSPHLHFHVMDGPDPLASDGLPFQFDRQDWVGRATGDDAIDPLFRGEALALAADGQRGERTDAMPLYLDVVDLTAASSSSSSSSSSSASASASSAGTSTSETATASATG